jgi:hypothetical protein
MGTDPLSGDKISPLPKKRKFSSELLFSVRIGAE